jgi:very-short-patch-repair endonuclease
MILNPTRAEQLVWEALCNWERARSKGLIFERQVVIRGYIVDFFCDKVKLVIELDGAIHNRKEQKEKDAQRDAHLFHSGIKVMRFANPRRKHDVTRLMFKVWAEARYRLRQAERGLYTFPTAQSYQEEKDKKKEIGESHDREKCGKVEKPEPKPIYGCHRQVFANIELAQRAVARLIKYNIVGEVEKCPNCGKIHVRETRVPAGTKPPIT